MPVRVDSATVKSHRWVACASLTFLCTAVGPASGQSRPEANPFETLELSTPGRPVQAWGVRLGSGCQRPRARQLLVLSVSGVPPHERHHWSAFGCLAPEDSAPPPGLLWTRELPPEVVGVDTADVRADLPGDELLWISAEGVRVVPADAESPGEWLEASGGLPLPARSRGISRLPVVADWEANGQLAALLPTTTGIRLVSLGGPRRLEIALPIEGSYRTASSDPPADSPELLKSYLTWPQLARGDDDGDARKDLFALWRFGAWVFRVDANGLPSRPTRVASFQPFSDEQEIRREASGVQIFVRDVNRDGLADLVIDRTTGSMLSSFASTEVHLNPGTGATLDGEPAARLESEGAIAGIDVIDLDGDGSAELFRTALRFNVFQMLRFVVTRRARVDFAAIRLDESARDGWIETWSDHVSLDIDWRAGRIAGVFPDVRGDLNGDGRPDLVVPSGKRRIAIRLGRSGRDGAGFGSLVAEQPLPVKSASLWPEDLDGDGLDELVVYDPRDRSGRLFVLRNRGMLPGRPIDQTIP